MGKMMEQGPVLVITFNSQQILCVKDKTGKVIEGSDDKVSWFSGHGRVQNGGLLSNQKNKLEID